MLADEGLRKDYDLTLRKAKTRHRRARGKVLCLARRWSSPGSRF